MKGEPMHRRSLLSLLGTSAAAWPLAARAQQFGKLPAIGFLGGSTQALQASWTAAFVRRLRDFGWIEGRTIAIEYRWAEGRSERYAEIAAEFGRLKVDVIVVNGTGPTLATKHATSLIPIVFAAGDPLGSGIVASLARPGGNITGFSTQTAETAGKRLELLREAVPGLRRLAILANTRVPNAVAEMIEVQNAGHTLGVEVVPLEIGGSQDIPLAFAASKDRTDALYVATDPVTLTQRLQIAILAAGARLPTLCGFRDYVEAGGLMSYGASFPDLYRRAAEFVDKILRGTKPADIPVEQPTRFDLVVNLTAAKAIGLTIPETFLVRATEVIE
jgi:putative ABC transport system substrate-binding protein